MPTRLVFITQKVDRAHPVLAATVPVTASPETAAAPPRVPIADANPRPAPPGEAGADHPTEASPTEVEAVPPPPVDSRWESATTEVAAIRPAVPPATVDLRGDGLADPVRHDDDPTVPARPIAAGEPGRA